MSLPAGMSILSSNHNNTTRSSYPHHFPDSLTGFFDVFIHPPFSCYSYDSNNSASQFKEEDDRW